MKAHLNARKTVSLLLVVLLAACLTAILVTGAAENVGAAAEPSQTPTWEGGTATAFASGTGRAEDPYVISNGDELALLSGIINGTITEVNGTPINKRDYNGLNMHYRLGADIVLNDTQNHGAWNESYAPRNKFTPIGTGSDFSFYSNFDGAGHTISGLYVNEQSYAGLFGYAMSDSKNVIQNIKLEKSVIIGHNESVGSLVGDLEGATEVKNCVSDAKVISFVITSNTSGILGGGGIVGKMQTSYIGQAPVLTDCVFTGVVEGRFPVVVGDQKDNKNIGGIVGVIYASKSSLPTIQNCVNKGAVEVHMPNNDIKPYLYVGGVVGHIYRGGYVLNSGNEGTIRVESFHSQIIGGVIGYANEWAVGSLTGLWNTGKIYARVEASLSGSTKLSIGGVIGHFWNKGDTECDIKDLYNSGDIDANVKATNVYFGGLVGDNYSNTGQRLKIGNAVNEGGFNAVVNGTTAKGGAVIGNSTIPLILNNFVNFSKRVPAPNEAGFRIAGQHSSTLEGSNIILPRENGTEDNITYKELECEIFFLSANGTTHKSIDALSSLNSFSSENGLSEWVDGGKRRGLDGTVYTYFLPKVFADRFGHGGAAYNAASPVYQALTGKGTAAEPYLIGNAGQLASFQRIFNDNIYMGTTLTAEQLAKYKGADVHYKLTADIYLNNIEPFLALGSQFNLWTSVDNFTGVFDGGGHTIYGLYMTNSGFFSYVSDSTIKNLRIENAYVQGSAILVYSATGSTIENVRVSGNLDNRYQHCGAIVAVAATTSIRNCVADVKIVNHTNSSYPLNVGGIAGRFEGDYNGDIASEIVDCAFYGEISSIIRSSNFGGIVGSTQYNVLIENCVLYGSVQGNYYVGGIVGFGSNGTRIVGCSTSADAAVLCNGHQDRWAYIGGIVGALGSSSNELFWENAVIGCVSAAPIGFAFVTTTSTTYIYTGGVVGGILDGASILNNRVQPTALMTCTVPNGATGKEFHGGGVVGSIEENLNVADYLQVVIGGNVVAAYFGVDDTISTSYKIFSGISAVVSNVNTTIINNVVEGYSYYIGSDTTSAVVSSALSGVHFPAGNTDPITVENNFAATNFAATTDSQLLTGIRDIDIKKNNYFYDPYSGKMTNDGVNFNHLYRLDESQILCATVAEAVNARAAEYNFPAEGALPLGDRLIYLKWDSQSQSHSMDEAPIYYARYEARRPDNNEYIGGFFVNDGALAENKTRLNSNDVAYAGFTFKGWTYGAGKGVYFDFSTPIDRNYTFKAEYAMAPIETDHSADINIVYDGKSHTITLNPQVLHPLGTRNFWYRTVAPDGTTSEATQLETDSLTFEDVVSGRYRIGIDVNYGDKWGTGYNRGISHTFNVEIRKAPLTVNGLIAESRKYDATVNVNLTGGELSGVKSNDSNVLDDVSVVSLPTKGTMADKNVGQNKAVSFSEIQIQGADAGNYEFEQPVLTTNITQAQVSLNGVSAVNKVYDGKTDVRIAATYLNNVLLSDNVSFDPSNTVAKVADKNVGLAKPVTVESVALLGTDKDNYVCVIPTGLKVDITPRQLNIVNLTLATSSREYDQTTAVALSGGELSGVLEGDTVSCVMPTVGHIANKGVGQNKKVTVTPPALTGTHKDNYTVAIASELYIDIVVRPVRITNVKAVDRVYNRTTDVELTGTVVNGFIEGDDIEYVIPAQGKISKPDVGLNLSVMVSWGEPQGLDAGNYKVYQPEGITVNITPKPLSIEGITATPRAYDGTLDVAISGSGAQIKNVEQGDDVSFTLPGKGRLDTADAGLGKRVSVSDIILTSQTAPEILKNYSIDTQYTTVDVTPREIAANWDGISSFVYNGAVQAPNATAATQVSREFAVLTISGGQTNAGGPYTATATLTSVTNGKTSNYKLIGTTFEFSIEKRGVEVRIYKSATYTPDTVWSNSEWNGNVTGLVTGHVFTGSVSTTSAAEGTYTSAAGRFNYNDIAILDAQSADVTANYEITYDLTVQILPAGIKFTPEPYIGTYDAQPHSIELTVTTPSITVKYGTSPNDLSDIKPTFTNAGVYVVYFQLSGSSYQTVNSSETVRIEPAAITAELTATGGTYNGTEFAASCTVRGTPPTTVDVTLTYTGTTNGGAEYSSTAAPRLAGSYVVTATVENKNYSLAETREEFTIARAETSISVENVERNYVYNGEMQTVNSGAVVSHNETEALYENNTFTHVGTGSYTITISAVQTDNYLAATTTVVINVEKASLIDASSAYEGVYDGELHGISVSASGFKGEDDMKLANIQYSLDSVTWSDTAVTVRNVADSKTVQYKMTFDDYNTIQDSKTVTVTPKNLTIEGVTASDQVYDQSLNVHLIKGGSLIGTVIGDSVHAVVPDKGTMADKNVGANKRVTLRDITLEGEQAGNYTLTQPDVFVNVTPASLTAQGLRAVTKAYDGNAVITILTEGSSLHTIISGDDVSIVAAVARAKATRAGENDADAGINKELVFESISLGGEDKDNYVVTLPTGLRCTITPRELTFTLTADGGVYTGSPIPATYTDSGWLTDESGNITLRYTGTTNGEAAYDSTDAPHLAGAYKVTASIDNPNYSLGSLIEKSFDIARAAAAIDIRDVETQFVYTGYKQIVDSGAILNHDESDLIYYDNVFTDVGTGSTLVKFRAEQSDNYNAAHAEVTVTIARRVITVSVTESVVYTGSVWSTRDWEGHVANLVTGHVFTGQAATAAATVGVYDTAQSGFVFTDIAVTDADGTDLTANYEIAYSDFTVEISKRAITVSLDKSAVYTGSIWTNQVWDGHVTNLAQGHVFSGQADTVASDAGVYDSAQNGFVFANIAVTDADGADVTANYDIVYDGFTVTIEKREITVSLDESIVYNGSVWSTRDWEGRVTNLAQGHMFSGQADTAASDAGVYDSAENGFVFTNIAITDANAADFTANYEIIYDLTVVIKSASIAGENGVEISSDNGFDPGVDLQTENLEPGDYAGLKLGDKAVVVLTAKDISLVHNGQPAAIEGTATVRMLIDEALRGRNDLMVVFIDDEGNVTDMNATREGDYMVFQTSHNSVYAIVAYQTEAEPKALSDAAIIGIALGLIALIIIAIIIAVVRKKRSRGGDPDGDGPAYGGEPENASGEKPSEDGESLPAEEAPAADIEGEASEEAFASEAPSEDEPSQEKTDDEASEEGTAAENATTDAEPSDETQTPAEAEPDNADNDGRAGAQLQENAVVFVPTEQSLDEAFEALSDEQKDFYLRLRAHALEKEGAQANKTQSYEAIRCGRRNIVKLSIKRSTTVAAFSLEHPLLKQYKKQSGDDESDAIKIKPTEVFVSSAAAFNAAQDMIDIVAGQLAIEKGESKKRRKAPPKDSAAEQE